MSKTKKEILKIIISFVMLILAIIIKFPNEYINLALYILSYIIIGKNVVIKAIKNILNKQWLDENFLMTIATIGAIAIREYPEAVAVMIFYQIGELFQNYAVKKSRNSIQSLMNIRPDYANVIRNEKVEKIDPSEVKLDEIIEIKAGEKVALDGIIIDGNSTLDTSSLTGESIPKRVQIGDEILSGCVNITGLLKVRVTKVYEESTVSKILDLIENATSKKAKSENFITRFARYYTPIVVLLAILLAVIPTIIYKDTSFSIWLERALTFLVISCPCALVISVPLSFFGGIGGAAKQGILVKGSNYLEDISKVNTIVVDKTGTLTKGTFKVQKIYAKDISKEELLKLTAYCEYNSNHPIAISLKNEYKEKVDVSKIEQVEELTGLGIKAKVFGKQILVGNATLMRENNISFDEIQEIGTIIYVAIEGEYSGYIVISDEIKEEAKQAIDTMKKIGIDKIIMLTGDKNEIAQAVAKKLGIDEVYSELLPTDKYQRLEDIMKNKLGNKKVAFVGDGINDAPSLARSDVGIAMGGIGSDAAIESSDIVIMTDDISKISNAINISKKTIKIVKQNIIFAIGIKILVLVLGAIGISNIWEAVFADVGVSVIAILNAMRAMR